MTTRNLIRLAVLLGLLAGMTSCRAVVATRPDGTRFFAASLLTEPEIAEFDAETSQGKVSLRGYKSSEAEVVGAAVRAAVEGAKP